VDLHAILRGEDGGDRGERRELLPPRRVIRAARDLDEQRARHVGVDREHVREAEEIARDEGVRHALFHDAGQIPALAEVAEGARRRAHHQVSIPSDSTRTINARSSSHGS
jgi:hypothetical protein